MKIIAISGKAESGKTFAANIMQDILEEKGFSVQILPLAFFLKKEAKQMGWDGEKDERGRTFLQALGKTMKAYHGMDYYAKKTINLAKELNYDYIIIDDLRLPEELNALKEQDLTTIRVFRPNHENKLTEEQRNDISEVGLDKCLDFDIFIKNDGDETFATKIANLFLSRT